MDLKNTLRKITEETLANETREIKRIAEEHIEKLPKKMEERALYGKNYLHFEIENDDKGMRIAKYVREWLKNNGFEVDQSFSHHRMQIVITIEW